MASVVFDTFSIDPGISRSTTKTIIIIVTIATDTIGWTIFDYRSGVVFILFNTYSFTYLETDFTFVTIVITGTLYTVITIVNRGTILTSIVIILSVVTIFVFFTIRFSWSRYR